MARMSVKLVDGWSIVTIEGRLVPRDLRRLEHLCGRALEQPKAPLTLRLTQATAYDHVVQAYLDRLVKRGAVVQGR